jgi:dTDP-4-amino-4,6-dideoxygalactose transaminase
MAQGVYKITERFEQLLAEYTGAPFAVAVDSGSNAIFLSLMYEGIRGKVITIPSHTYPSVPCEIIHAGGRVHFSHSSQKLKGAYVLMGSMVIDSALRLTCDMYESEYFMCLSFTGPHKHLKLGKGGAILTDSRKAYLWFKRARFSGRRECSYHEDTFDTLGWNFYMLPEVATRGILLLQQFYDYNGNPLENEDIELPYPNLSKFSIYKERRM